MCFYLRLLILDRGIWNEGKILGSEDSGAEMGGTVCANKFSFPVATVSSLCFLLVMHVEQKGYNYFPACEFNENLGNLALFFPTQSWLSDGFTLLFEKPIYVEKLCQSGMNPCFVVYVSSQTQA